MKTLQNKKNSFYCLQLCYKVMIKKVSQEEGKKYREETWNLWSKGRTTEMVNITYSLLILLKYM